MPGTVLKLILFLGSFSKDRSLIKQSYRGLISCPQDFLSSQSTGSPLWQGTHVKHSTWSLGSLSLDGRKEEAAPLPPSWVGEWVLSAQSSPKRPSLQISNIQQLIPSRLSSGSRFSESCDWFCAHY